MGLFKKIYYQSASLLPIGPLKKISAVDVLLPYHHLVSDERLKHICHLYSYKNKKQFTNDLDYLLKYFSPIDPADLIRAVKNGSSIPKNTFLLTFDDGFREIYEVAAPILLQKGVPALFFLNTSFLDNKELFYRNKISLIIDEFNKHSQGDPVARQLQQILRLPVNDSQQIKSAILQINYTNKEMADELGTCLGISFSEYLSNARPYISTAQVKDLIVKGFYFGSHSLDHPNYKLLALDDQLNQTWQSCSIIRGSFNLSYSAFSFPHEDVHVRQKFFDDLFTDKNSPVDILFGTQNQKHEINNRMLHRFNAERPEVPIEGLVKGMLLYNLKKKMVNRS